MSTLLLTRSEIETLLDPITLLAGLRRAFVAYSTDSAGRAHRVRSQLPGPGTATVLFPGTTPGADVLANASADTAAVIGAGVQGRCQLRSFAALRRLRRASVYDVVPERSRAFAQQLSPELGFAVEVADCVADAIQDAEEVIRNALFVCDDRELAVEMGAVGGVGLGLDAIAAELGEVLPGLHPGRTSSEQVTVYGGVGLAFQDVVAAWTIYETARLRGVGKEIDFIG